MKKKYTFVPPKYIVTCKRELKNNILEMKRITSKTEILFHPFFRDAGPKACKKYIFILVEDSMSAAQRPRNTGSVASLTKHETVVEVKNVFRDRLLEITIHCSIILTVYEWFIALSSRLYLHHSYQANN